MAQAIPIILTLVSTAVAVQGARMQARSQQHASDYNAEVAEQNATVARDQAAMEAAQIDRQNRLRLGTARASAGAAGISGAGTVIDLVGDIVSQGELERQDALYRGELRARGFEAEGGLFRSQAKGAKRAGRISAGAALLSGASTAHSQGQALRLGGDG